MRCTAGYMARPFTYTCTLRPTSISLLQKFKKCSLYKCQWQQDMLKLAVVIKKATVISSKLSKCHYQYY